MQRYSLSHLSDDALRRGLSGAVAQERGATAELLAHIAEFDARKLYLPAAYPSMFAYCVGELHLSEDATLKRIRAARAAQEFPAIYVAIADGRLHLSAVVLLAPRLNRDNAAELLAAAAHKSKAQVEQLMAECFPQPDLATVVRAIPGTASLPAASPQPMTSASAECVHSPTDSLAPGPVAPSLAPQVVPPHSSARITPRSPERYAIQLTVSRETHDRLRRVQGLLGHTVPSRDLETVFDRALVLLEKSLERQRFSATDRPGRSRQSKRPRHVPAKVRRAVWKRDGGQCTFTSDTGHRCESRHGLEFDHVQEIARGGTATVSNIRLRCRAHNQFEAERTFGVEFMRHKRAVAARSQAAAT